MSTFIQTSLLGQQAGDKTLFANLNLTIKRGDRIGLTGHNGCGKSTLLALLAGRLAPDQGQVHANAGCRIAMVEQHLPRALYDETLLSALLCLLPAEERLHQGYRAERLLQQLGLPTSLFERPVDALSGGQQNSLLLARALISEPDLLLLDEPSNHLDLAGQQLLEAFLAGCRQSFVIISHDRRLLDAVTNRTLVLRDRQLLSFALPFTRARQALAEQDAAAAERFAGEQVKIDQLRRSAKRLATWGRDHDNEDLCRKAKSMERRIERLENERTEVSRGSPLALHMQTRAVRSKQLLAAEGWRIATPEGQPLLTVDSLVLRPGDRLALLGANGCGKTSTIAALVRAHESGEQQPALRLNPQLSIGYYDQLQHRLDESWTLTEALGCQGEADDGQIRQALIKAGFAYGDHQRRVASLSGGERARLMFQQIWLQRPNLQIFDEPTNHLDIEGREALEAQLRESEASAIITSHDRHFIETVCNRFVLIDCGRLVELHGLPDWSQVVSPLAETAAATDAAPVVDAGATADGDEDSWLARLCELESMLAADCQRKPRHQKPARQQQWRREIAVLQDKLGL